MVNVYAYQDTPKALRINGLYNLVFRFECVGFMHLAVKSESMSFVCAVFKFRAAVFSVECVDCGTLR